MLTQSCKNGTASRVCTKKCLPAALRCTHNLLQLLALAFQVAPLHQSSSYHLSHQSSAQQCTCWIQRSGLASLTSLFIHHCPICHKRSNPGPARGGRGRLSAPGSPDLNFPRSANRTFSHTRHCQRWEGKARRTCTSSWCTSSRWRSMSASAAPWLAALCAAGSASISACTCRHSE